MEVNGDELQSRADRVQHPLYRDRIAMPNVKPRLRSSPRAAAVKHAMLHINGISAVLDSYE